MKISRVEAVKMFGTQGVKNYFKKYNKLNNACEKILARSILTQYESVEREGYGENTVYILGKKRDVVINKKDVVLPVFKRARSYPDEFYRDDVAVIYCVTNTITGEKYVGATTQMLAHRVSEHKSRAFNPNCKEYNHLLQQSIRKYGFDAFTWEIVMYWNDEDTLHLMEDIVICTQRTAKTGLNDRFNFNNLDELNVRKTATA